uniref:RRM domain-containing protein n=1 Tax=Kalanchoe fedtschenkoi TaxID=63787 RepID=A0A7N0TUG1_KALFE
MGSRKGDYGDGASPGKIFIGGLAKDTTLATFVKYFEKYGEITDSVIMKDRQTGRPRGFGFITYADPSVVDNLIEDTHVINGKQVEIKRTIPKGAAQPNDFKTKKIFVGGIPASIEEDDFKSFFSKFGKVVEHEIIRDHETKRSRGFGFIVFDSEQVVDKVMANGNKIDMMGSQVEVKKAEPKKPSNQAHGFSQGSDSRSRVHNDRFGGYGNSYSGFGGDDFGPGPYRSHGGYGSRYNGYGGYGSGPSRGGGEFGGPYGGFGGSSMGGYRGDSSFGYPSRYGSFAGGYGGGYSGGSYARGGYGGYGPSGPGVGGFEAGPGGFEPSPGVGGFERGPGAGGFERGPGAGGFEPPGPMAGGFEPGPGAGGYEPSPGAGFGRGGGPYGSRAGYGGSSRYHPYAR